MLNPSVGHCSFLTFNSVEIGLSGLLVRIAVGPSDPDHLPTSHNPAEELLCGEKGFHSGRGIGMRTGWTHAVLLTWGRLFMLETNTSGICIGSFRRKKERP